MPETESAQHPAGAAASEERERLRLKWATAAILVALAIVVIVLRFHRLSEIPPGLSNDEGVDGSLALQVLRGEHALFFPVNGGRTASAIYALALSTSLLGRTLVAMHLPTALGSAGIVFVVFWLGRLLFGQDKSGRSAPWQGLFIGGVGAGLTAVSIGQTIIGRTSYNKVTHMTLLLCLCLGLLWWGWSKMERQQSWWRIALAGVCAGLLPYTYIPARFTPLLFLLFGLSFLLPTGSATREGRRVGLLKQSLPQAALFMVVAGLVAAPMLVYFALNPSHFFMRSDELWILNPENTQGDPWGALLKNVWDYLLVLGFRGDPNWRYNFAGQPMLNPWEASCFWLGLGLALMRWKQPVYRLLLLCLVVMLLPAILARELYFLVPNSLRMSGATPAIYLLASVGLWETFRFTRARFFGNRQNRANLAAAIMISGVVLAQGALTYHTYFDKWAVAPGVFRAHDVEWAELAWTLNAQPPAAGLVYLAPYTISWNPSLEYLYQGEAPIHVVHANMPDLAPEIESILAGVDNVATVKVVTWNDNLPWADYGGEHIVALLNKHGHYVGSDEYSSFQFHTFTDIALDRPWTFYEQLESTTIHYDGGISLLGFALGHGEQQLSAQEMLDLGTERASWIALQWRTAPGLEIDYWISLRLHDAKGATVYQEDLVLVDRDRAQTSQWKVDMPVDNLFHLEFPADLPPGKYELRLVVYDAETLKPTVELGVWEPEATLARLQLAEPH